MQVSGLLYTFYGMAIMFQLMVAWLFCYQRHTRSRLSLCALSFLILLKYVKDLFFVPLISIHVGVDTSLVNVLDVFLLPAYIYVMFVCQQVRSFGAGASIAFFVPYVICVAMYASTRSIRFYFLLLAISSIYALITFIASIRSCREQNYRMKALFALQMSMFVIWFLEIFIPGSITDIIYMSLTMLGLFISYLLLNHVSSSHPSYCPLHADESAARFADVEDATACGDMVSSADPCENVQCLDCDDLQSPDHGSIGCDEESTVRDNEYFNELTLRLDKLFEDERIYLDPTLRLSSLAQKMCTNRTYLSKYFNQIKGQSFYDYVNTFRVEYSLSLLRSSEYTFEAIATMSGFNSLSTYRRAFQQIYGCSPRQYREGKIPPPSRRQGKDHE